ncbi:serine/threonine-protein kinase [Sorangium atrum]|uniref:Serine/threonine-protein kinase n=1 Tax=Sorangium atrum TaxID=2995308 RepID=A0ABT5BWC5_9BACT|nr:serine/threonine-protein kinase [Sorangium aterium]MDC0677271.1 serine/threonine-protein kinase [Sorangium aterium]
MDVEPGTIVGDKYRLEGPLSRGGMGSVWLARHLQLGAPAAIKFMDPEHAASPEFRARFYREARTAANLDSPHVVSVQDYGIWGTVPYLVMELLRGEDLSRRLRRVRRVSLAEAARIAIQTGKALRRAHESGLVHRDLKPGNLFLSRVDEDEEIVKVLDFGIAKQLTGKLLTDETTRTGELLGSPFYMSPEQARGDRNLDARSDLWSLGVILFRAVTGKLPFEGDVLGAVLSRILVEPIPLATHLAPDVPADLDGFFVRALSRDRAQRFQSAQEMVHAFVAAAGDPSIPLPVPSAPQPAPVTSRTGTLLGLSPGGTGELEAPGELAPLSRSGDQGPRQDALVPLAEPSQHGTLTAASAGEVRADRRPHASATLRWLVACGALSAISGTVAVTALRPVGEEDAAPYHVIAPIEPESVSAAAPAPALEVVRASTAVVVRLPAAEVAPAADAALPAATAEPAASAERKAPRAPSAPRRSPRRSREIIDPWQRR